MRAIALFCGVAQVAYLYTHTGPVWIGVLRILSALACFSIATARDSQESVTNLQSD